MHLMPQLYAKNTLHLHTFIATLTWLTIKSLLLISPVYYFFLFVCFFVPSFKSAFDGGVCKSTFFFFLFFCLLLIITIFKEEESCF